MSEPRDPRMLAESLSGWLAEQVAAAGVEGVIFGISGGIDSAVVCGLAARGLGAERCLGLVMPIGSLAEDTELGHEVARTFGVRALQPELMPAFAALDAALRAERDAAGIGAVSDTAEQLAVANLKPRLRMIALYYFANLLNYMVVGTGNRAELTVGYFTKFGDAGVDLLLLGDLTKGEVVALARELGVPERVVERPPSAGLWEGQTDEDELGMTYAQIDRYLLTGSSGDPGVDGMIRRRFESSQHKRAAPPIARPG